MLVYFCIATIATETFYHHVICDLKMSSDSVLDIILSAIISSNEFQTVDDKIWATVAKLVPSASPEEVSLLHR